MINFAEFLGLVPKENEVIEVYVYEGNTKYHFDPFDIDTSELHYPWYQYRVSNVFTYYDYDKNDSVLHLRIDFMGEDNNAKKE